MLLCNVAFEEVIEAGESDDSIMKTRFFQEIIYPAYKKLVVDFNQTNKTQRFK